MFKGGLLLSFLEVEGFGASAALAPDPDWILGLSLSLMRGVRPLRGCLTRTEDRDRWQKENRMKALDSSLEVEDEQLVLDDGHSNTLVAAFLRRGRMVT